MNTLSLKDLIQAHCYSGTWNFCIFHSACMYDIHVIWIHLCWSMSLRHRISKMFSFPLLSNSGARASKADAFLASSICMTWTWWSNSMDFSQSIETLIYLSPCFWQKFCERAGEDRRGFTQQTNAKVATMPDNKFWPATMKSNVEGVRGWNEYRMIQKLPSVPFQ